MVSEDYCNFQRGLLGSPRCSGCRWNCEVLYDAHHDQYFSVECGTVIMEMGVFCVDYYDDLDKIFEEYNVRFRRQRERLNEKDARRK